MIIAQYMDVVVQSQMLLARCRCNGVAWGNDELALLYESEWKTRRSVISTFAPGNPQAGSKLLFDRQATTHSTVSPKLCSPSCKSPQVIAGIMPQAASTLLIKPAHTLVLLAA